MSFELPKISTENHIYKINDESKTKEIDVLNIISTQLNGANLKNVPTDAKVKFFSQVTELKKNYDDKTHIIIRFFQKIFGNPAEKKVSQIYQQLNIEKESIEKLNVINQIKNTENYYTSLPIDCQFNLEDCTLPRLLEILQQAQKSPYILPPEIIEKIFTKLEKRTPAQLQNKNLAELKARVLDIYSEQKTCDKATLIELITLLSFTETDEVQLKELNKTKNNDLIQFVTFALITLVQDEDK